LSAKSKITSDLTILQLVGEQDLEEVPVLLGRQVAVLLGGQGQADLDVTPRALRLAVGLLKGVPTFQTRRWNILKKGRII